MSQEGDVRYVEEHGRFWVFPDGTKLPVISGGDGSEDGGDEGGESEAESDDTAEADLGDAGRKAVERERKAAWHAKQQLGALKKEVEELRSAKEQLDKLQADAMSEQEKAISKARKEAAEEARKGVLTEVNKERVADRIRAVAADKYHDPEDAVLYLLSEFEAEDASNLDKDALVKRMDEHLAEKNYLAKDDKKVRGDADGGKRGTKDKPEVQPGIDRLRAAYAASGKT